jgi:penicillin-binding protein 1A
VPQAPEGLVAVGEGRERTYVYTENYKEPEEESLLRSLLPSWLPVHDLRSPPSD